MPDPKLRRLIDVFISSPSDVRPERQAAIRVIDRLNRTSHIARRFVLKPLAYEALVPPVIGNAPQQIVDTYMQRASQADLFIGLMWSRMGTPVLDEQTGENFQSGTEYEFVQAYRANQQTGRPQILFYRGIQPVPASADRGQVQAVEAFFAHFEGQNALYKGLYKTFETTDAFAEMLFHDLDQILAGPAFADPATQLTSPGMHYYRHIQLPQNYIPRPELLAEARTALLADTSNIALTSAISSNAMALHGMGGIGKSVIARALCDDPQVQSAFPDGILWATLGQEPNIMLRLREWIEALGGLVTENAPSESHLSNQLRQLLETRSCLLILDDVWQIRHTLSFRVGGPYSRLLITTRNVEIAHALKAQVLPIRLMTQAQAVQLLQEWSGDAVASLELEHKLEIVNRLGRLPLALKLAGAQLRNELAAHWLESFDARKLKSQRAEGDVHDSFEQTLNMSLESLAREDRQLYTALAIFKEDDPLPETAIRHLWGQLDGLDEASVTELLTDLQSRALIEVVRQETGLQVFLHDLLRDFLHTQLGSAYAAMHQALLAAYQHAHNTTEWHRVPDDGYLYNHLLYHLKALQSSDDIRTLFADQHWMHVRFTQRNYDYDGYLEDLAVAWSQLAELTHSSNKEPLEHLAIHVRYALIRTSINSLAENYSPAHISQAVVLGLWQPVRALNMTARIPDLLRRVKMVASLLGTGKLSHDEYDKVQESALNALLAAETEHSLSLGLAILGPYLQGMYCEKAVKIALSIPAERACIASLGPLVPHLDDELIQTCINHVLDFTDERAYADALTVFVPYLSHRQKQRAARRAEGLNLPAYRARALAAVTALPATTVNPSAVLSTIQASDLAPTQLQAAIATSLSIQDGRAVGRALENLGPTEPSPSEEDPQIVITDVAALLTNRPSTFTDLLCPDNRRAETMPDEHLIDRLMSYPEVGDEFERSEILALLTPHLPDDLLTQALQAVTELKNPALQVATLNQILPFLPDPQKAYSILESALAASLYALRDENREQVLKLLADNKLFNASTLSPQVCQEIFTQIKAICQEWHWL